MNAQEFLTLLLPPIGVIFTATNLEGKGWHNTSHISITSTVQHINRLTFENQQAYFALSTFDKPRVWDPDWKNPAGETVGKWRTRTQANAKYIKSFYLDLDVDPADPKKFASKIDALTELRAFTKKVGLPKPMLIDSGGGIHAYWPLFAHVTTDEWRPVAEQFKAICLHERFKADKSLTSDHARVLRCLGGFNTRRNASVKLLAESNGPYDFAIFGECFDRYLSSHDLDAVVRAPATGTPLVGQAAEFVDNLGASNDPLHFDRISFSCAQIGAQAAVRGAGIGEKLWRAGLGIAKFCDPQAPAYRAISDRHAEYDEVATVTKITNWRTGPTACAHFHTENPATCEACPHWQKITSPAQLGRAIHEAPAPAVTVTDEAGVATTIQIPEPPAPYKRKKNGGVVIESEDQHGATIYVPICPYDLYPIKILRQNGTDATVDERSAWRVHLPRIGACDMELPQSILSDPKRLYGHLLSKGVYMSQEESKATQNYMSAYLQTLAVQADREKLYERLGWHDEHTSFVLGTRVLHRDGTSVPHNPGHAVRSVTKDGVTTAGTLDGWKQAVQFYNRPGYEGHRFFLYASLGAPLFHMNDTGNKGVLLTASGESGRGKTTCLKACASLWGDPERLLLNGNKDGSTINALYESLGTYHSLPFLWDDITEREPDEIRRLLLNISQGRGKERMKGTELVGKAVSWETIVLASANTDDISRIMATGKDVSPHLMRLVGVEFKSIDNGVESKIQADEFIRQINRNYGHVGPILMKTAVENYHAVARLVVKNVAMVDRALGSANASAERYWSAAVAVAYTGAQLAVRLGLLPNFPYEADLQWMVDHLIKQRNIIKEGYASPLDIIAEFLEKNISGTLIVSAKQAGNIDNVAAKPTRALVVRHELDYNIIYASRSEVINHCAEVRTSFRKLEQMLTESGVLIAHNMQKVLGADTIYAKGQTRVWKLDATKLRDEVTDKAIQHVQMAQVVPIGVAPGTGARSI